MRGNKRKLFKFLLGGKRIRWGRVTLRVMPLRWYLGPGVAPGYFALNVGPLQLFIDIWDLMVKVLDEPTEEVAEVEL